VGDYYENNNHLPGAVVDICDSIVSVVGFDSAFSGELVYFKDDKSELTGFI
jgi:F0F1-type ATP synthase alpha subunit